MVKNLNELKPKDIVYRISIYETTSAIPNNCRKAYSIVGNDFCLERQYRASSIEEYIVTSVNYDYYCFVAIRLTNENHNDIVIKLPHDNTPCYCNRVFGSYHIVSTTKEMLIEKAKEIIYAIIEVKRNTTLQQEKILNEILKGLEMS